MKRAEWEVLKALPLDEKKRRMEEAFAKFMDLQSDYTKRKEADKWLEIGVTLCKMIDFKPDPNYYKNKRAEERRAKCQAKYDEIKGIANFKKFVG